MSDDEETHLRQLRDMTVHELRRYALSIKGLPIAGRQISRANPVDLIYYLMTLKYPVPKSITAHFRGTGWALAALYLSPDVTYYIDGSSLGPENFTVTGRELLEHIKLPVSLQVVEVKPETLLLALDDYIEKR